MPSFIDAIRGPHATIIGEVKNGNLSGHKYFEMYRPGIVARAYEKGGVAALSVVTAPGLFRGSLDHLMEVREYVDLPILRKDFITDPQQIVEAKLYGANAVLLIVPLLHDQWLKILYETAMELGLEVVLECHSAGDISRAWRVGDARTSMIGINNRCLKTGRIDLSRTHKLMGDRDAATKSFTFISESGIESPSDIAFLREVGAHSFLVGDSLLRRGEFALSDFTSRLVNLSRA